MTDSEQTGNVNERCDVDETICDADDSTIESDGYSTDDYSTDGYLSDFYVSTPLRTDTLRKLKEKKKKILDGPKKYYKPKPKELVEIKLLEKQLVKAETTDDRINMYANAKNVSHLDDTNYQHVIESKEILLLLIYHHCCYYSRQVFPEFLKAAYALKVRFGDRVTLAVCNSAINRKVADVFENWHSPNLLLFRNGILSQKYEGGRTAEDLKSFVEKAYRDHYEEKRKKPKTKEENV